MSLENKLRGTRKKIAAIAMAGLLTIAAACKKEASPQGQEQPGSGVEAASILENESHAIPSYESHLENVIMHARPDIRLQEPLIQSLPTYTRITLLTPDSMEKEVKSNIKGMQVDSKRIHIISYKGDYMWRGLWAQDLLEVLTTKQGKTLMLPDFYTFENYYLAPELYTPNQETDSFASFLNKQGYRTQIINAYFEGGNITYDHHNGQDLLFLGDANLIDRDWNLLTGARESWP